MAVENSIRRVLLVEDHLINQKVAAAMLARLGFAVDIANNGEEALDAFARAPRNDHYDVVLMDCQMPVMDGYRCTRAIREHQRPLGEHTPIVALTAFALQGDREKCFAAGMDDFIAKPVSLDTLRDTLSKYVTTRSVVAESPVTEGIDFVTFNEIRDILEEGFAQLIETFYADSAEQLLRLKHGVDHANARVAASAAHILKGSSDSIGAHRLALVCGELETAALEQRLDDTPELIASIDAELQRVFAFLQPYRVRRN
jgi:CheY-like chemotaxis protein/HPt (histidine-containing phosphotransfer) domain-containing protein